MLDILVVLVVNIKYTNSPSRFNVRYIIAVHVVNVRYRSSPCR